MKILISMKNLTLLTTICFLFVCGSVFGQIGTTTSVPNDDLVLTGDGGVIEGDCFSMNIVKYGKKLECLELSLNINYNNGNGSYVAVFDNFGNIEDCYKNQVIKWCYTEPYPKDVVIKCYTASNSHGPTNSTLCFQSEGCVVTVGDGG